MPYPMNRQQNILDDVIHQHAIGNLFADNAPDRRNDGPQQMRIRIAIARLRACHQCGPCFARR